MVSDHYGVHESIEIAKGKNEIPTNWEKAYNQLKRIWRRK
jgi:hypothetical protein